MGLGTAHQRTHAWPATLVVTLALATLGGCGDDAEPTGPGDPSDPPPQDTIPRPDPPSALDLTVELRFDGFQVPVLLTHAPGDDRLFVVERRGLVHVASASGARRDNCLGDPATRFQPLRSRHSTTGSAARRAFKYSSRLEQ